MVLCALASFLILETNSFSFIRYSSSYLSSQAPLLMVKPAFINASSMVSLYLTLTAPEPVPPIIVCLTPLPIKVIGQAFLIGKALSSLFKKREHS